MSERTDWRRVAFDKNEYIDDLQRTIARLTAERDYYIRCCRLYRYLMEEAIATGDLPKHIKDEMAEALKGGEG